jgi:hypothetical protein
MLIIVHSLVYFFRGCSHHLLVVYLNPKQQEEISCQCQFIKWLSDDFNACVKMVVGGVIMMGSVVVAFMILVE